jgi:HEPN domain-containing protein
MLVGPGGPWLFGETRLNRQELQRLTDERVADAEALLAAQRWSGAYYMAGYAVECALKACILAYIESHIEVVFGVRKYVEDCWTHDIRKLVKQAALEGKLDTDTAHNGGLQRNWQAVKDWTERSRYEAKGRQDAEELLAAITDTADGVLPWLKSLW